MAFRGSSTAKLDDRGRLKIPAAFRDFFKSAPDVFVTQRRGPAVLLYPMQTFEEQVEDRLDTQAGLNDEAASTLRQMNANGLATQVDGQGRVTLSQDLRERSGFEPGSELRIVGMRNYLEIWKEEDLRNQESD